MKKMIYGVISSPFTYALMGVLTMSIMLLLRVYAQLDVAYCLLLAVVALAFVVTGNYMQVVYAGKASDALEKGLCWATILLWLLVGVLLVIRIVWLLYAILG